MKDELRVLEVELKQEKMRLETKRDKFESRLTMDELADFNQVVGRIWQIDRDIKRLTKIYE